MLRNDTTITEHSSQNKHKNKMNTERFVNVKSPFFNLVFLLCWTNCDTSFGCDRQNSYKGGTNQHLRRTSFSSLLRVDDHHFFCHDIVPIAAPITSFSGKVLLGSSIDCTSSMVTSCAFWSHCYDLHIFWKKVIIIIGRWWDNHGNVFHVGGGDA